MSGTANTATTAPVGLLRTWASFVKLSHTVFALPFAVAGLVAAHAVPTAFVYISQAPGDLPRLQDFDRHVPFSWVLLALVLVCMVGARTFAMALNRIMDRRIDALNPRTEGRELPAGRITLPQAWGLALLAALAYFAACYAISPVVALLSPIPVAMMALYPLTKRFTALCHLWLGATLGLAPVGAWVAARAMAPVGMGFETRGGEWQTAGWRAYLFGDEAIWNGLGWQALTEPAPWVLGLAVALWVGGFDVIYALQDVEFDRSHGLHSMPARLGRSRALWLARILHLLSAAAFAAFVWVLRNPPALGNGMDVAQYTTLASWIWSAPALMALGMAFQHRLVRADDLRRVDLAFFTVNGVIAVAFGTIFVAAWLMA
ncbi:MAG: UbiA family prenyltransferase [Planctomycetes bacterium]|nr:UbiA family prenyltransferase [Planctomycetota bacterium]